MRRSATVLALWSLFVWGTRIKNAVSGDEGAGAVLLAVTFVALAGLVLVTKGRHGPFALALAGWTAAVWAVRAVDIAFLSDHGAAFVVVHLVLAAVSIGLAVWVARDVLAARPTPARRPA